MNPQAVINKVAKLLESDDLQLRIAAIRVIAELGITSRAVTRALGDCLQESDEELQLAALKGLARLGAQDVTRAVVPLILTPGPVRERATQVLEAIGSPVVPEVTRLYGDADFQGKRAIINTLAKVGSPKSLTFLLKMLPGESFELQKYLTVQIAEAIDRLQPAAQTTIFPAVDRLSRDGASKARASSAPQVLVTAAILMGHFRGGRNLVMRARQSLRRLAEEKNPPEVRRHAMVSFNRLSNEVKLTAAERGFVEEMLCDEDWYNMAQYALANFQRLNVAKKDLLSLVSLLKSSPHFSIHIHVFKRLNDSDRPDVAKAILPFLGDNRFRVREAAQEALKKIPSAIESLFGVLMENNDLEITQRVNAILRDFPPETQKKFVKKACQRLLSLYEQNDPHYNSFLEFVRAVDPEPLRRLLYEKSWSLKGKRSRDKWERIASYLKLLWDNHLINAEGRYLLGVACLRLNSKELAPAARRANLGLKVLRALIYDNNEALVKRLRSDKDLTADDFYYLGFHFSEEGGEVRPFGLLMLKHAVKRFPRDKVAEAAKRKLKLQTALQEKEEEAAEQARARGKKSASGSRRRRVAKSSGKAATTAASVPEVPGTDVSQPRISKKKAAKKASKKKVAKKASKKKTVKKAGKKKVAKKASKKKTVKKAGKKKVAKKAGKKKVAKKAGKKKVAKKAGKKKVAKKKAGKTSKSRPGTSSGKRKSGATSKRKKKGKKPRSRAAAARSKKGRDAKQKSAAVRRPPRLN